MIVIFRLYDMEPRRHVLIIIVPLRDPLRDLPAAFVFCSTAWITVHPPSM